jgi:EAL domain-containing protein (putative c-di-GMP-specific phosphodiesterase class I)
LYDSAEGIEDQYKTNIAMSAQIRQALIEHRIVCQYQPIVNCKTGVTDKYETLVRIQRDDGTLIPPNDFLPIAKKTKLYSSITQEVIYQACHTFSNRTEHFSINLSNSDILDPHTLTTIERILKQTNTANRIVFEILESEGIENFDEVALFITRMKELGASIAIDDFGSGYSNFENILKLNVDFLKIDGSLIKTIDQNPRHRIVVESIVDFAHRIGIETIAEFVATEDILSIVTELGITYSQGYHTGKPMSL